MKTNIEELLIRWQRYRRVRLKRRLRRLKVLGRRPVAVPFITFFVLILLSLGIYLAGRHSTYFLQYQGVKIVIISHDGQEQVVPTRQPTVGALLGKLHLPLSPGDVVEPAAVAPIDQDQFRINIYRAIPVQIVDGNHIYSSFSAAKTARSVVEQTGTQLFPEDIVKAEPTTDFVSSGAVGEQLLINRATPVNVDLFGAQVTLRTHAKTISGLITAEHIKLLPTDQIEPGADSPISPNMQITFLRTGTRVETDQVAVPTPVQVIYDNTLAYGTSAVRQQGSAGENLITYQVSIVNNVETGRTQTQSIVIKPAVPEIVVEGTSLAGIKGDMALAGISPSDYSYVDYIVSNESGWCPTKIQGQYGGCQPLTGGVPSYGGYGLCQSTPGGKMATAGSDWETNPVTQLRWCSNYAASAYGSWYNAYNHWLAYHNW